MMEGEEPIYKLVATRYMELIEKGALKEGDKLPSVRESAHLYSCNPMTAAKAYDELVERGYVRPLPRSGYIVLPASSFGQRKSELSKAVSRLLAEGWEGKEIIEEVSRQCKSKSKS